MNLNNFKISNMYYIDIDLLNYDYWKLVFGILYFIVLFLVILNFDIVFCNFNIWRLVLGIFYLFDLFLVILIFGGWYRC